MRKCPKEQLGDFYNKSYKDPEYKKKYPAIVQQLLSAHNTGLSDPQKQALVNGDAIQIAADKSAAMKDFLIAVTNDKTFRVELKSFHNEMIKKYGGALSKPQKAIIRSGNAVRIADEMQVEHQACTVKRSGEVVGPLGSAYVTWSFFTPTASSSLKTNAKATTKTKPK